MPEVFADLSTPILVVDDHSDMIRLVSHVMSSMGFINVRHASDGLTALETAKSIGFGLIITDLQMQPQNGLDFIESLRKEEGAKTPPDVPFIVLTGYTEPGLIVMIKDAGVDQILHKPFKKEELKACVEACLGPLQKA